MKVSITLLSVLLAFNLVCHYCIAQTANQSTIIMGGDLAMEYKSSGKNTSNNTDESFTFDLIPKIGVFTSKKIAVGLNYGIEYFKTSDYEDLKVISGGYTSTVTAEVEQKEKLIVLKSFLSIYHFFNENTGIKNDLSAGVAFGSGVTSMNGSTVNGDYDVFEFLASYQLRFLFLPTKKIGLNIALIDFDYSHRNEKRFDATYQTADLKFNSPLNLLSIGLEFYIGGIQQ